MFCAAAHTDIGPRKKSNQDSCCVEVMQTPLGEVALLVVCDGVGGLSSGEVASASTIRWVSEWFEQVLPRNLASFASHRDRLLDFVQEEWGKGLDRMNDAIQAKGHQEGAQMGTTFTAALLFGGGYVIGHVGDSRVYQFSEGRMEILTTDQTWVAQEVARGNLTPEKARVHPKRNVILQSVGTQSDLQPVFSRGTYAEGDTFMVCCDGFRNELFDEELLDGFGDMSCISASAMENRCKQLVELVLQRGERDNITVACLSCQPDAASGENSLDGTCDLPTTILDENAEALCGPAGSRSSEEGR